MGIFLRRSMIGLSLLGSYAEGTLVKINEDGAPVEFYIAKHDYEPDLNGGGGTLLFRMDACADLMHFAEDNNAYADGTLDTWSNETYFQRLDPSLRAKILLTKFYYTPGNGNTEVTTLERKIFQLSVTEYGLTGNSTTLNIEGVEIQVASGHKIAKSNGGAVAHWTRSPNIFNKARAWYLSPSGEATGNSNAYSANRRPRPAFVLPSNTLVGDDMLIT